MSDADIQPWAQPADDSGAPVRRFSYELAFFLPAPPHRVWTAITLDLDRWWTYRLRDRARCVIEPHVGGRWMQEWDNGGALFGTFNVFDPPRLLSVSGPLAMTEAAVNALDFELEAVEGGTRLVVRHEAFGCFDAAAGEIYESGWRELLGTALLDHLSR